MTTTSGNRGEDVVQIIILLTIGGIAGAASFTHVHDWTMHNAPPGTGNWFGWANAVISELTPTAAGLEIRRRKRHNNHRVTYPMALLIAAAALSLTAQVAEARHSLTGWLVAALPALAFLALTKLVVSRTTAERDPDDRTDKSGVLPPTDEPLPPGLLTGARMAVFNHRQLTEQDMTAATLATQLAIPADLAHRLLNALDDTGITGHPSPPVTYPNGTGHTGNRP
jgi:hypothetical protein